MSSKTSLGGTYKNSGYTPVMVQGYGGATVAGTVHSFGSRSAVELEDGKAGESASFGFGGEWQFSRTDIAAPTVPGTPIFDDGTGTLSGTAGTGGVQVGIVTSVDSEIWTIFLF